METEIKGLFNGQDMVAEDGKTYPVNENYASKSKLNEGDELKLTIAEDGSFYYKQLYRVPVTRMRGNVKWVNNHCTIITGTGDYRVLRATATYFKLRDGDEVVLLTPKDTPSKWASIENVIRFLKDEEKEMDEV